MNESKTATTSKPRIGWVRRILVYVGKILVLVGVLDADKEFEENVEESNRGAKDLADSLERTNRKLSGIDGCLQAIQDGDRTKAVELACESFDLSQESEDLRRVHEAYKKGELAKALETIRDKKLYRDLIEVCRREFQAVFKLHEQVEGFLGRAHELVSSATEAADFKTVAARASTVLDELPRLRMRYAALRQQLEESSARAQALGRTIEATLERVQALEEGKAAGA